jgi:hypothetical protein
LSAAKRRGGRILWTHLGNPGWYSGRGSGLGIFEGDAVDLPGLEGRHGADPSPGQFCFGAVPYTVQRHDCRGIIAVATARVHAIGGRMTGAAVATTIVCRKPGCFCARTQAVVPKRSSAAIATGAISTAPTVRHTRAGGRCMQRGGATRRAIVAGLNTRRDRAATGRGKIK